MVREDENLSLTGLDVALSGQERDGNVGDAGNCWLPREFEESLADRAVDLIRRAASCGRETPIEVVSRIGIGVGCAST